VDYRFDKDIEEVECHCGGARICRGVINLLK
jgi:hypothetical protein